MGDLAQDKRRDREQRLSRARRAGRLRIAAVAVAVVSVLAGAIWLYKSDVFRVTEIKVVGAKRLSEQQVVSLADVPRDSNLLRLPSEAIEKRVMSSPWVATARVGREFPHTVRIMVEERRPFAAVVVGRAAYLVDKTGVVLAAQPATMTQLPLISDLPLTTRPLPSQLLSGREFSNALQVLSALPEKLRAQVTLVYARSVDDLRLVTKSGLEIVFGRAEQLDKKTFFVDKLIRENPKRIIYIDVRAPDTPTAKYAP